MIKNIIIIAFIVIMVFLGHKPYFQEKGDFLIKKVDGYINPYYQKIDNFIKNNILSWVGGEVGKRKNIISEEIVKEKEKISQSIWQKIKNFMAEKFSNLFGTKVE